MLILFLLFYIGYINCNIIHYVKENDTCLSIMKKYNIYEFHDIYNIDCDNIKKYEKIDIINDNMMIISVKGLENLINSFNSTEEEIDSEELKCSNFQKDDYIHKHIVENDKETCYDIINKYNIFIDTFYEINPNIDCNKLSKDDIINIITDKSIIVNFPFSSSTINEYVKKKYKSKTIHFEL